MQAERRFEERHRARVSKVIFLLVISPALIMSDLGSLFKKMVEGIILAVLCSTKQFLVILKSSSHVEKHKDSGTLRYTRKGSPRDRSKWHSSIPFH